MLGRIFCTERSPEENDPNPYLCRGEIWAGVEIAANILVNNGFHIIDSDSKAGRIILGRNLGEVVIFRITHGRMQLETVDDKNTGDQDLILLVKNLLMDISSGESVRGGSSLRAWEPACVARMRDAYHATVWKLTGFLGGGGDESTITHIL